MASEAERAKILAEYLQDADKDVEDEDEFQADDYDDDDDEGSYDGVEEDTGDDNYAVLEGKIMINDEGRIVYGGNWCMKKDLDKQALKTDKEKRNTRFKLKSKQSLGKKGRFDPLMNPLMPNKGPRTVIFDGFFTTDATDTVEPHRKIKEQEIEIIFAQGIPMKKKNASGDEKEAKNVQNDSEAPCFLVKGKGLNDFGTFALEGIYCPSPRSKDGHTLTCSKKYCRAPKENGNYDSEDDYEISGDEAADLTELCGLADDAQLSVEDLRKKYYGGDDDDEGRNAEDGDDCKKKASSDDSNDVKPAKRRKLDIEDDDDCGF